MHMYDHIGACMGVQQLELADSQDYPLDSPMQDS